MLVTDVAVSHALRLPDNVSETDRFVFFFLFFFCVCN